VIHIPHAARSAQISSAPFNNSRASFGAKSQNGSRLQKSPPAIEFSACDGHMAHLSRVCVIKYSGGREMYAGQVLWLYRLLTCSHIVASYLSLAARKYFVCAGNKQFRSNFNFFSLILYFSFLSLHHFFPLPLSHL